MTIPAQIKMSPEDLLRAEVFEILREYEVEMPLLNGIPNAQTERDIRQVGELIRKLMFTDKVAASVRVELLGQLLDAGISPDARFGSQLINGRNPAKNGAGRRSLLMMAVGQRFPEGMSLLLDRGADILAAKEDCGYSVAGLAIANGDAKCLRIALERASLKDFYGNRYLEKDGSQAPYQLFETASAINAGWKWDGDNVEVIRVLQNAGMSREGLLAEAARKANDCPSIIDALVEGGCDVNEQHFAPATTAASNGKVKMLQRLFELGADSTANTPGGATLMQCAGKHSEVKELIRSWKTGHAVSKAIGGEVDQAPARRRTGVVL